jgi:5-formyltetrahydrofolate cyclo-ligase
MDEIKEKKQEIRNLVSTRLKQLSEGERSERNRNIEDRLFNLANFVEAKISLLYIHQGDEVSTREIIERCFKYSKIVVLPTFDPVKLKMKLLKVDNLKEDLKPGPRGIPEPDENRCKMVPLEFIDIAVIPGVAFDEKGGRIGNGEGYYDRLIPRLPITTRKVALALESQIFPQVPMESHDRYMDIIITENRVIYKI